MVSGGPTPVKRATATAFGEGRTTVAMVLVGEQPGDQEDK
jgi:uracil-DNA glycosylase